MSACEARLTGALLLHITCNRQVTNQ